MEKVRAELAIFFIEKARALHLTSFLLSVLLYTIATSQSGRKNLDSYICKIKYRPQKTAINLLWVFFFFFFTNMAI